MDAAAASVSNEPTAYVQWMWSANRDSSTQSESVEYKPYSDIENMIIEEAFQAGQHHVVLDNYRIDFKHSIEILNEDANQQRSVQRIRRSIQ